MSAGLTRRNFFRPGTRNASFRPPWAAADFLDRCNQCGDCSRACPERILAAGDGGFPTIDFRRGGCSFCGDCAAACKAGALRNQAEPWALVAVVAERCMSAQGVACRVCGDWCRDGAIRFRLMTGGRARPEIDAGRCSGCGGCVKPCPVGAIAIARVEGEIAACA